MSEHDEDDEKEMVCERHNVKSLPSGYSRCPYCDEEARIRAEREHLMTRDRRVEPW